MMELQYDPKADAASVLVRGPIEPGGGHHKDRLDADRFVRYRDSDNAILQYEFLNVKRYGVRLDDLEHREGLRMLFREAGFQERDWGHPLATNVVRRWRDIATG
ncbi:MAG TPA: hypothetical protein VFH48_39255 [Chloroflexota bacterium]|nr:hypothetical protein [Chloroflexota bacterium]